MRGISLLEVMVYLLIVAVTAAGIHPFFSSVLHHNYEQKQKALILQGFATMTSAFSSALRQLDRTRLPIHPYIFAGKPVFSSGAILPLTRAVLAESSGWAMLRPAFLPPFALQNKQSVGQRLTATICGDSTTKISSKLAAAVAFCDSGMQEVTVYQGSHFKNKDGLSCLSLTLEPTDNMVLRTENTWNLSFAVGIHFVEETFFYYIDVSHEFRRVQLEGTRIIENQPVFSHMPTIAIQEHSEYQSPVYFFSEPSQKITSRFSRTLLPILTAVLALSMLTTIPS